MRVVTRFEQSSREYVVEVEWPERATTIERFTDHAAFNERVQRLHMELLESQWEQDGGPAILADGWRGPGTTQ